MSLLKRKLEKDRKAAEEAARLAEEKKLQALAVHPLVKDGCGRDVVDAYLQGLVFAAIADDDKIDKGERALLKKIGTSLGMPGEEVDDTIKGVLSLDDDGKIALVEECVTALKGNEVGVKLFYAQFVQVWTSHEHDEEELGEYLGKFAEWTGVGLVQEKRKAILAAIAGGKGLDEGLYDLAEWMGDDALKYFVVGRMGDVSDSLARKRSQKKSEEDRRRRKKAEAAATEKANQQIDNAMEDVVQNYRDCASVTMEALRYSSDLVKGIDGDKIDWPTKVNPLLKQYSTKQRSMWSEYNRIDRTKCRANVWRLITLLMLDYAPQRSRMTSELDWLLSSSNIERPSWPERIAALVSSYLADRVTLV